MLCRWGSALVCGTQVSSLNFSTTRTHKSGPWNAGFHPSSLDNWQNYHDRVGEMCRFHQHTNNRVYHWNRLRIVSWILLLLTLKSARVACSFSSCDLRNWKSHSSSSRIIKLIKPPLLFLMLMCVSMMMPQILNWVFFVSVLMFLYLCYSLKITQHGCVLGCD